MAEVCKQTNEKGEKSRERKPNFSEMEMNVLQSEVERNFDILNEKFGSGSTNAKKNAIWDRITIQINALGVAKRTAKECRDKWANTKRAAKKAFTQQKTERSKTGGGPPPKKLSLAVERTIDLCKDSASFKGITGGLETEINGKHSFYLNAFKKPPKMYIQS